MSLEEGGTVLFAAVERARGFALVEDAGGARFEIAEAVVVRVDFFGAESSERAVRLSTRDGSTFEEDGEFVRVVRVVLVGNALAFEGAGGGLVAVGILPEVEGESMIKSRREVSQRERFLPLSLSATNTIDKQNQRHPQEFQRRYE